MPDSNGAWRLRCARSASLISLFERRPKLPRHRLTNAESPVRMRYLQDVCPWNRTAAIVEGVVPGARQVAPALESFVELTAEEFRALFRKTPVWRTKYTGFLRNVAIALGNSDLRRRGNH